MKKKETVLDTKTAETVKPVKPVKKKTEPAKKEPVKKEPAKKEPAKKEPAKKEPVKKEPVKNEPVKKEPVKNEPVKKPSAKKTVKKTGGNDFSVSHHKKLRLTKTKQKHYIALLHELKGIFVEQVQFHKEDALSSKKDSAGERAGMATHMADLGTDNFRHDLELGLMSDEGDVLEMIDEALQRIESSEYGICVECGCEINPERLEAKPYARYCIRCKTKFEEMEDPHKRHR